MECDGKNKAQGTGTKKVSTFDNLPLFLLPRLRVLDIVP